MHRYLIIAALALSLVAKSAAAFTLYEKKGSEPGSTLLLVGGIQGDEPGGFMAANLLLTHYTITRGNVRLVPNLNFASIIARSRGVHGDMNRKFVKVGEADPEYGLVERIKRIIRDPQVDGVINLHDGSGFYRANYIDRLHNPYRWGQATIIDQALLPKAAYGAMEHIAAGVRDYVNAHLLEAEHRFSLKNTRTREGDEEMAKTLTYYAISQGKPAFAVEASKAFGTVKRVYYHLLAVEAYLKAFDIEYERSLPLTLDGIEAAIYAQPQIALFDRRIVLDVADARRRLRYVPMEKGPEVAYEASSPLVALLGRRDGYQVSYGNNRQTLLQPQYMEFDDSLDGVWVEQDGGDTQVPFGAIITVKKKAGVRVPAGYRVNLIGYTRKGRTNEVGIRVGRNDFQRRFSVDRGGWLYRAEVYRGKRFCGMVLLDALQWRASGKARSIGAGSVVSRLAGTVAGEPAGR
jgi:hypothetical protein